MVSLHETRPPGWPEAGNRRPEAVGRRWAARPSRTRPLAPSGGRPKRAHGAPTRRKINLPVWPTTGMAQTGRLTDIAQTREIQYRWVRGPVWAIPVVGHTGRFSFRRATGIRAPHMWRIKNSIQNYDPLCSSEITFKIVDPKLWISL